MIFYNTTRRSQCMIGQRTSFWVLNSILFPLCPSGSLECNPQFADYVKTIRLIFEPHNWGLQICVQYHANMSIRIAHSSFESSVTVVSRACIESGSVTRRGRKGLCISTSLYISLLLLMVLCSGEMKFILMLIQHWIKWILCCWQQKIFSYALNLFIHSFLLLHSFIWALGFRENERECWKKFI